MLHRTRISLALSLLMASAIAGAAAPTFTRTMAGNVPTLNWTCDAGTTAVASGGAGWTGTKACPGSQTLPAITANTNYTLTFTAAVNGVAALSWDPPTANTDGSPLTDLVGFRVYSGTTPTAFTTSRHHQKR